MNVPTYTKQKFTDQDGELLPSVQQFFDVFFTQAQENLSNDGMVIPALSTADINRICSTANSNAKPSGTLMYDNQTNQLKICILGVAKVIPTL
jgi:hypothetical protein